MSSTPNDGNDTITLKGIYANSVVDLGGGDDTFNGGAGNDNISGGAGNELLLGYGGNDKLDGQGGRLDRMFGGEGNDTILDADGVNGAHGNEGNDAIDITFASDWLSPNGQHRSDGKITGGYGNDTITVTMNHRDFFINLKGDEPVSGTPNDGNDTVTLKGTYANSVVDLGGDDDTFNGGIGNDNVSGGNGNDQIWGQVGNDRLEGNAGADNLNGGSGKDSISAGDGNDTVEGGLDNDTLYGEAGDDILWGDQRRAVSINQSLTIRYQQSLSQELSAYIPRVKGNDPLTGLNGANLGEGAGDGVDEIVAFSFLFPTFSTIQSARLVLDLTAGSSLINTDELLFSDNLSQRGGRSKAYGNNLLKSIKTGSRRSVAFDLLKLDTKSGKENLSSLLLDGDLNIVYPDDAIIHNARLEIVGSSEIGGSGDNNAPGGKDNLNGGKEQLNMPAPAIPLDNLLSLLNAIDRVGREHPPVDTCSVYPVGVS